MQRSKCVVVAVAIAADTVVVCHRHHHFPFISCLFFQHSLFFSSFWHIFDASSFCWTVFGSCQLIYRFSVGNRKLNIHFNFAFEAEANAFHCHRVLSDKHHFANNKKEISKEVRSNNGK